MQRYISLSELVEFYKEFEEVSPLKILVLLIFSLGIYAPTWIYQRNREFESLSANAPSSTRGALCMFFFPVGWALISTVLQLIFELKGHVTFEVMNGIIWTGLFFLAINYLYDFTKTFGGYTFTDYRLWLFFLTMGTMGIVGLGLWNFYLIPFSGFFLISIPAMQEGFNQQYERYQTKRMYSLFYNR